MLEPLMNDRQRRETHGQTAQLDQVMLSRILFHINLQGREQYLFPRKLIPEALELFNDIRKEIDHKN
jgi:hypothetical protein